MASKKEPSGPYKWAQAAQWPIASHKFVKVQTHMEVSQICHKIMLYFIYLTTYLPTYLPTSLPPYLPTYLWIL